MAKTIESRPKSFLFRDLDPNILIATARYRYAGWIGQIYSEGRYVRKELPGGATKSGTKPSMKKPCRVSRGTPFNNSVDMKGDRKIRKGLCGDQPALTLPGIGEFPGCSGQPSRNEPSGGWLYGEVPDTLEGGRPCFY
jgi:hypothetical protein